METHGRGSGIFHEKIQTELRHIPNKTTHVYLRNGKSFWHHKILAESSLC